MTETSTKDGDVGAFLVPTGFTDTADFHDCWKKVYMFIATDGSIPQLVAERSGLQQSRTCRNFAALSYN